MLTILAKIFALIDRRDRLHFLLLLVPMALAAVMEMASIALVFPIINGMLDGPGHSPGLLGRLDLLVPEGLRASTLGMTVFFVAVFAIKNLLFLGATYLSNRVTAAKQGKFMTRLYRHYLCRGYSRHLTVNSGQLLFTLGQAAPAAFESIVVCLAIVLDVLMGLAAFAMMVVAAPAFTLTACAVLVVAGGLFHLVVGPFFLRWGAAAYASEMGAVGVAKESFGVFKDIQLFRCQPHFIAAYGRHVLRLAFYKSLAATNLHTSRLFMELLMVIGAFTAVGALLESTGSVAETASVVAMFGLAALRLMPSANRILSALAELKRRSTMIGALHADLVEAEGDAGRTAAPSPPPRPSLAEAIRVDGVSFRYPGAETDALHAVTLTIRKGESVGLVGPSGSGKSTLVDVLLGLLPPHTGRILADDWETGANLAEWQRRIGYVPQQINLLDDTVRRNVAFGLLDEDIDDARVWQALRLAHVEAVIRALPAGLDTTLGENGIRLSGGQRQRIGIARALYRDPEVLVLDEATSALDSETEREITRVIEELAGNRTLVLVAHRLSTLTHCDRLVFVRGGAIADVGSFAELESRVADFRKMVQLADLTGAQEGR
ncbi:MAG: ABC transporter ATP-binding protein [Magnetospirillum sp.]|nr:ABC transporter ATP-binding protein [Magnetospirillum sp.]